ncbi:hypothetical protein QR680_014389 [Steinernema hermaphroditum]|uniref:BPTI/Kunitz inhibitor domain-containing protein n=1 Tax=Steinernema hermaphroditum TaxID=289476 RepID=A0AA39I8P6_9BILA|nr:hypothetical protein QR680_014389 [Steinernema hermaphroditum]
MALRRLVCLLSLFCVSATFFGDEPSLSTANNGSFGVGKTCKYNTDCMEGAHCTQGSCKCWHTHVELDGFCWKKIGPDEIGCQHNLQCDAMWPESHCILGTCRCPIGQVAAITRDGTVCHQMGHCPTNGANPILFSRNKDTPAECFFYDRTTARFIGCDDYPDLYDCIAGICCPTRSFACAQPMDKGTRFDSAQPMVMRWYFDASLGSCQQFEFTGLGGNANNFETKRNCEAYCGNGCPRGQPQAGVSCGSGNGTTCHPNFKCINNLCCPDTAYICSEYGGLGGDSADLSKPSILPPYNIGSSKSGAAPAQRYHFDRTSKTCKTFSYLGQGGNFNNFATEKQCSEFCARTMCPAGNPLKLENGSSVQCSTDSQCPRTHYCVGGHCCPTSATICNQPLNTGAACNSEPTVRYGFNPIEGVCEKFTYNGCHGNENNFGTLEACTSICDRVEEEPKCVQGDALKLESGKFWRCGASQSKQQSCPKDYECHFDGRTHGCCPTRAFTCAQKADNGTLCDPGKSMRWYFDADAHICLTFEYGGCDGNSNNFPNRESCEQHCDVSVCPGGGRVQRTDYGKTVECDDSNPCAEGFSCTRLSNPLAFQSSGTKYCCPSRLAICSEKASAGVACSEAEIRYSFSPKDGGCRPFKYNGCGGNSNSFLSRQSCQQFCAASSCAMDEIVYFDGRSSDGPFDCSEKLCPDGFQCVKDVLKPSRNVCCGQPSFEVCPSKERPILDHITGKPLSCSQSIPTSCPHGTFCRQNEKRNQAYCCEKQVERPKCSNGWKAVLNSITSSSYGCSSDPQCPGTDAKCHGASQQQSGICCVTDNDVCPPLFSLDVTRTAASQCNPLAVDSCAADHSSVCMFSEKMNRFVCCQRDPRPDLTIQACPGSMAQDEQKSTCSFRTPCPVPYSCIRKNADMKGICCRHVQGRAVVKVKMQTKSSDGFEDKNLLPISAERFAVMSRGYRTPQHERSGSNLQRYVSRGIFMSPGILLFNEKLVMLL